VDVALLELAKTVQYSVVHQDILAVTRTHIFVAHPQGPLKDLGLLVVFRLMSSVWKSASAALEAQLARILTVAAPTTGSRATTVVALRMKAVRPLAAVRNLGSVLPVSYMEVSAAKKGTCAYPEACVARHTKCADKNAGVLQEKGVARHRRAEDAVVSRSTVVVEQTAVSRRVSVVTEPAVIRAPSAAGGGAVILNGV
jgi:hypothetical protein